MDGWNNGNQNTGQGFNNNGQMPGQSFNNNGQMPGQSFNNNGQMPGQGFNNNGQMPGQGFYNNGQMPMQGRQISNNIVLCNDGKYRWVYEMNLFKNPTIFFLVWKIFFFIVTIVMAISMIFSFTDAYDPPGEILLSNLKVYFIIILVMTVVVILGCLIFAAMYGGKYCVVFEMDDYGINHKQMPKEAKKAGILSTISIMAGILQNNPSTVAVGLNAARTEMYSPFQKVKKVIPCPSRNLIKVNGTLDHNQVYAEKEDFDFVLRFIMSRCPNLKA